MMKERLVPLGKKVVAKFGVTWGHLTNQWRVLPNFLIIGAQKAGTTSLYHHLICHPNIAPARFKELHFFDRHFSNGPEWYRAYFPRHGHSGESFVTGESTPDYLSGWWVPDRIRSIIPEAKFIVLLRNPVDRAYSHFHHNVRKGVEFRSFENAIEDERKRMMASEINTVGPNSKNFFGPFAYIGRSLYGPQIAHWLKYFSMDQFLFLNSEDLFSKPSFQFSRILSFLNLLPDPRLDNISECNKGGYAPLKGETRRDLEAFFRPHNKRLSGLLGQDFTWVG